MAEGLLAVDVVYAPGGEVWSRRVQVPCGSPVGVAIEASGVRQSFAELRDGDRVEIYLPLTIDPKDARRIRADVRRRRKTAAA